MKIGKSVIFLFLIISFYFAIGKTIKEEESDCDKLLPFLQDKIENCCESNGGIKCDNEGYITYLGLGGPITQNVDYYESFPYFSRIQGLELINLDLTKLPKNITKYSNLKHLSIDFNQIKEIPKTIQDLEYFSMGYNNLKEFLKEVFNLSKLKTLGFHGNHITVIPPDIKKLTKLEELYLYENEITELPNELFMLRNLKTLGLQKNKIKVIPPSIQKLSKLEGLDLMTNNITEFSNELFSLKYLKKFVCNYFEYI